MSMTKVFFIIATILIFAFEFIGLFMEARKLPPKKERQRSNYYWLIAFCIAIGVTAIGFIVFYNTIWKIIA